MYKISLYTFNRLMYFTNKKQKCEINTKEKIKQRKVQYEDKKNKIKNKRK